MPESDFEKVRKILQANATKSFVKRIINYAGPDKSPVLPEPDGSYATHKMADIEVDGRYFAYPTVLLNDQGALQDYGDKAWEHVAKTGNYIEFSSPQEANWFAKNYKLVWPSQFR